MTAKEKLESVRMYGRRVSEFLLPDQMKFIEIAMDEYAQQQLKILNIPVVSNSVCPNCGDSSTIGVSGMADIKCPKCGTVWANDC